MKTSRVIDRSSKLNGSVREHHAMKDLEIRNADVSIHLLVVFPTFG